MKSKKLAAALAAAVLLSAGTLARAQESAGTPGTVWEFSSIQVEPGQFEHYLDWLAGQWKRIQEAGKKDGYVVSYHVFQVNNTRVGEPDLILAIEYKDYLPNAERLAFQKKLEAMLATDAHKMDAAAGERKVLRKVLGSMELQELKLK
jgi:hypothetical protein